MRKPNILLSPKTIWNLKRHCFPIGFLLKRALFRFYVVLGESMCLKGVVGHFGIPRAASVPVAGFQLEMRIVILLPCTSAAIFDHGLHFLNTGLFLRWSSFPGRSLFIREISGNFNGDLVVRTAFKVVFIS